MFLRIVRSFSALVHVAAVWFAFGRAGAESSDFDTVVKPYLAAHCLECHGTKAKAGYRIDRLGTDFATVTTAEQWKEVIDRINAGEMPPEEKPRPDARE